MRSKLVLCVILGMASAALAQEPKDYETGQLVQMASVQFGADEKDAKSRAGEVLSGDSRQNKTHELLCQEYVLQCERVTYQIRPRDEKHPVLLPVSERV